MIIEILRVPVEASKGLTIESEVEIKEDKAYVMSNITAKFSMHSKLTWSLNSCYAK